MLNFGEKTLSFGKNQLLARARLSFILGALSHVHYGLTHKTWKGDLHVGELYFDNGQGDAFAACWNTTGLVGLSLDHETEEAVEQWELDEDDRRPQRLLPDLPDLLAPLLQKASKRNQRVFTSGVWAIGEEPIRVVRLDDWGEAVLGAYQLSDEAVLISTDRFQGWTELNSLSEAQARLALRWSRRSGPLSVSDEDVALILAAPLKERAPANNPEYIRKAAEMLAAVSIEWTPRLEALPPPRSC